MARKFFSFLGRGSYDKERDSYGYKSCIYSFNGVKSTKTEFVQEAIYQILIPEVNPKDKICIFITPTVEKENWIKLNAILAPKYKEILHPVVINDFQTKDDIWALFEQLYENIEEGDEIHLDITHSFRYLPMLYLTVLNYAQYLKKITVGGIYYGAYEAKINENGEEEAPIFDLTDMFETMQWANAADLFSNFGIAKRIKMLSRKNKDEKSFDKLSRSISSVADNVNYSRGKKIVDGNIFKKCMERIDEYTSSQTVKHNPALIPILDQVKGKIANFNINSAVNFLPAVQWYIDHDMPAEALSMMKDGIITYLISVARINCQKPAFRLLLGKRLSFGGAFVYKDEEKIYEIDIERIMQNPIVDELKPIIEGFSKSRNDIDHCGFENKAKSPSNISKVIKKSYMDIRKIFVNYGIID